MSEFGLFAEMVVLGFFGFGFWSIFKGLIRRQHERIVQLDKTLKETHEKQNITEERLHKADIHAVELRSQIDALIAAGESIQLRQSIEIAGLKADNKRLKAEWMELLDLEAKALSNESKHIDPSDIKGADT